MKSLRLAILLILGFYFTQTHAQKTLNLDFESPFINEKPMSWSYLSAPKNMRFQLDAATAQSGKNSLLISAIDPQKTGSAGLTNYQIPLEWLKGKKKIILSAFVKGDSDAVANITIAIKVMGKTNPAQANASKTPTEWTKVTAEDNLDGMTKGAFLYIYYEGKGQVWIDNLTVQIDGENVVDTPPMDPSVWLDKNAIPITALGKTTPDYAFMAQQFKNTPYIGLGETTHGTHEFLTSRTDMMAYLMDKMNFTYIALENAMFDTDKLNAYVLTGKGNPQQLILKHVATIWYTQELLDMVEMVKKHNDNHEKKVKFVGFDMQVADGALQNIEIFAEENKLSGLDNAIKSLIGVPRNADALQKMAVVSTELKALETQFPKEKMQFLERNAHLMTQYYQYNPQNGYWRDSVMAARLTILNTIFNKPNPIIFSFLDLKKTTPKYSKKGFRCTATAAAATYKN